MIPPANTVRQSLSKTIQAMVKSYPSVNRYPIAWGEQDAFQHLNNVYHIRYFENGRSRLGELGYHNFIKGNGIGVIMKEISVKYKVPMTFPDNMIVATSMGNLKKDRYTQFSLLISEREERVVAECLGVVVSYDHDVLAKADLPEGYVKAYNDILKEYGPQKVFAVPKM